MNMRVSPKAFLAAMLFTSVAAAGPDNNNKADTQQTTQTETDKTKALQQDGRLGVMVMDLSPALRDFFGASKDRGVLVAEVMPDSPAARAGIRVGDVITTLSHEKVDDVSDIRSELSRMQSPQSVSIEVVRGHKPVTVQASIGTTSGSKSRG
jgi:S1-C subfamily serine protease